MLASVQANDIRTLTGRLEAMLQQVDEDDWALVLLVVNGQLDGLEKILELIRHKPRNGAAQWLSQIANVHRLLHAIAVVDSGQGVGYASVDDLWHEIEIRAEQDVYRT